MEINSRQYEAAREGWFCVQCNAHEDEEIILNMPTARGRRFLHVGHVAEVKALGFGRNLIRAERLEHVEGIY
jgi:tRNA U34 2-thiouridine synthase MnmA/TrmU